MPTSGYGFIDIGLPMRHSCCDPRESALSRNADRSHCGGLIWAAFGRVSVSE
jgi:hypothetical protein